MDLNSFLSLSDTICVALACIYRFNGVLIISQVVKANLAYMRVKKRHLV